MSVYTLREFRAKTREAFDLVLEGKEVVIKRGVYTFKLIESDERVHRQDSVYTKPVINKPEDVVVCG